MTNKPKDSDSPILSDAARFREAFERLREDIAAVGEEDLVAMAVDVPTVVVAVLGRISQLLEFRRALLRALPELDIGHLDRLQTCARALGHAHTLYIGPEEGNALADMASELSRCRKMLVNDVTALAQREMVDGAKLKELLGPVGYKNLALETTLGGTLDFYMRDLRPLFPGRSLTKERFTYELSDHLPLWVHVHTAHF